MGPLTNPRHEAFVQGLYAGQTAEKAYINAGYKPSRPNASRLTTNENVVARLRELNERGQRSADITKERLTEMLLKERGLASASGQHAAAISAIQHIAKLHGLFVDKVESTNLNFDVSSEPLTEEEWAARFPPR